MNRIKYGRLTIISIMTFIMTVFALLSAEASVFAASGDYIKVGLKYGGNTVSKCTISVSDSLVLGTASTSGFSKDLPLAAYNKAIATVEQGAVVLKDENGTLLSADLGSNGCVMPLNYDGGGTIALDGAEYRGGFILIPSGNKIKVINFISGEQYLYGVLHSEMGQSSPEEALKAQAVAARSYIAANTGSHASDGFDVCPTTHCQVYGGVSKEYPSTNKAVDETAGEVIYSEGKPVTAFYSKNSGGYTQNSEDVWFSAEPYLRAVKDTYAPNYPWTASFTFSELQQKLESAGHSPGKIQSVAIKQRAVSGAVYELEIIGDKKTISLKKDSVRTTLGASNVKSLMFNLVDSVDSGGTVAADGVSVSNGQTKQAAGSELYVLSSSGNASKKSTAELYYSNGTTTAKQGTGSNGSGQTVQTVTTSPLNISGNGYGHGVGMAQDGAMAMAKQGFDYQDILKFYYTGIEIR